MVHKSWNTGFYTKIKMAKDMKIFLAFGTDLVP